MSSLVKIASSQLDRHGFYLHSHFDVGPTASSPNRLSASINQVEVRGVPLASFEDFRVPADAFEGKAFVRFPRREGIKADRSVHGRAARLRCEPMPFDSFWLPHHCIVGENMLRRVKEEMPRRAPSSAAHVGSGSRSVAARS